MPLVPSNIVSAWYARSSWVYQNFAFLFVNPLWTTKVPNGFSLCPFFWFAMFSFIVFRPLVYLTLGLGAIVKTLRLQRLLAWTDSLLPLERPAPGLPTVVLMCLLAMAGLVLSVIVKGAINCWVAGVFGAFALPAVLLTTLVTTGIYYACTKNDHDRCKVEVYLRVVTGLCLISAVVFHPAYAYESFVQLPLDALAGVWHGLSVAALWMVHLLWGGAVWTWRFTPWVLAFTVIVGGYGWASMRLMRTPVTGTTVETVTAAERKRRLKELSNALYASNPGTSRGGGASSSAAKTC